MKKTVLKNLKLILIAGSLLWTHSALAVDLNEVECVQGVSKVVCKAKGYWSGSHWATCSANARVRLSDGKYYLHRLNSSAHAKTDTGGWAFLTLGISDAISNQGNAISVRSHARKDLQLQIDELNLIPKCSRN